METKIISFCISMILTIATLCGVLSIPVRVSASSAFTFKNTMSETVLNQYLARAVTFEGLCGEGGDENMLIEEDIRMLLRTGTKYVSRAALFAWTAVDASQVESHYAYAKKMAAKVHAADSEIILEAFVAEIVRKSCVNNIAIPDWVFTAFGKPVEKRNFSFDKMINLQKGASFWGANAGYPDYSREEAVMWYYYCIRRYIDAGYEAIHIQEGEEFSEYDEVDKLLKMSREYAKTHARRGIVLFHSFFSMITGGNKINNRLLFDIQGNGLVPIETVYEDGAMKCKIGDHRESGFGLQWLGRSNGGEHPLGFNVEQCPTLMEFDNYGQQGPLGVSNGTEFGTWGYDDITWFAVQPSSYRKEFLLYVTNYLKTHCLTSGGKQVYYCVYPMRRVITASPKWPETTYTTGKYYNEDFFFDYCESKVEKIGYDFVKNGVFSLTSKGFYRANRQSDGCPNGFGEEDTIRNIFLGNGASENPKYNTVVIPEKYRTSSQSSQTSSSGSKPSSGKPSSATGSGSSTSGQSQNNPSSGQSLSASQNDSGTPVSVSGDSEASNSGSPQSGADGGSETKGSALPFIIGGILLVLIAGGVGTGVYIRRRK